MYNIKIQQIAGPNSRSGNALPDTGRTVGTMPSLELAERFAAMWQRFDYVAFAWVERC